MKCELGNRNKDDFTINCIVCGSDAELSLTASRNTLGKVVGWVFACNDCQPDLHEKYTYEFKVR